MISGSQFLQFINSAAYNMDIRHPFLRIWRQANPIVTEWMYVYKFQLTLTYSEQKRPFNYFELGIR